MVGRILQASRDVRLRLWALKVRLRLRRLGMRADIAVAPGVRFETLPVLEIDPYSPPEGGGSLGLLIGRGVRLGRDLTIDVRLGADSSLTVGEGTNFQSWCRLQLHGGSMEIGRNCHIRDTVQIKTKSSVYLGDGTVLSRGAIVHGAAGVRIGDEVGIGERTSIIDSDHEIGGDEGFMHAPVRATPIEIADHVVTGANCVILRGSHLREGSALAAGAVLNGDEVPPGHLAGGVPARVLKDLRG
ncbi:MAG: acyltransferase [Solirubrobacteraceae bacterium]